MARILNVISAVTPAGGTVTKLRALMLNSKKHQHFLYHPGFKSNENIINEEFDWYAKHNITAYYKIYGRNIIKNVLEINRIIKRHKIDIVHFYFNHEQTFAGLVHLFNPKVKLVRSIVGYDHKLSIIRRTLLNTSLSYIKNYIYISQYIKELYETDYPKLKNKNTTIIYNGPVNVSTDISPLKNRINLVSTGGLCARKNQRVIIEAMNILVNQMGYKNLQLQLIGEGPLMDDYASMIHNYCLNNNVTLVGRTNDVSSYLNRCSIYLHPATTEGFGIAVTEAMFMGCACIVADKGALPELINDKCGIVVSHDNPHKWVDAIKSLISNPSIRIKMGEEAHQRAINNFSLSTFINKHEEYYSNLLLNE